jgi:hypothetical protein
MDDKLRIVVYEPNKKKKTVKEIDNTLEAMQEVVGGYIELVKLGRQDIVLVCNEEGRVLGLPKNRGFYGTFLFVGNTPPDFTSLTDEQLDFINKNL